MRQRPLRMAGPLHGQPWRVRAPQRGARFGLPRGLPLRSGPLRGNEFSRRIGSSASPDTAIATAATAAHLPASGTENRDPGFDAAARSRRIGSCMQTATVTADPDAARVAAGRFDAQGSGFDAVVRSRCMGSFAFCGTGVAADPDTACLADTGLKGSVLAMVPATRRMWF